MGLISQLPASRSSNHSQSAALLAYFGHHKCGSTWLGDITREMCASAGLVYASVHNPRSFEGDVSAFASRNHVDFLAYVNANRSFVSLLGNFRGFHVIRDPRDIVVSSYFSHLHSHATTDWPELIEHRRRLQEVDKDKGMFVVIDFLEGVLDDIATWDYADPRVLELKMEDVIRAPDEMLVQAFVFLGLVDEARIGVKGGVAAALSSLKRWHSSAFPFRVLPLPVSVVVDTLKRNSFAAKANGRTAGKEDVSSHYRKGVPGDWVNHFGPDHKAYFKARYGDLLIRLGYEDDLSW